MSLLKLPAEVQVPIAAGEACNLTQRALRRLCLGQDEHTGAVPIWGAVANSE